MLFNEQGDMRNPEKSKTGTSTKTPFRSFGYREMEKSRVETLQHRSPEVAKCETPKSRNRRITRSLATGFRIPGDRDVRDSHHQESRSAEMKSSGVKTRNRRTTRSIGYRDFGYREMEMSETLINRSPEIRNVKWRNDLSRWFKEVDH
jgi:hypothetical protein